MSSFEDRVRKFLKHSEELEATTGDEASEDGYNKEFLVRWSRNWFPPLIRCLFDSDALALATSRS